MTAIDAALKTPWKLRNEMRRLLSLPRNMLAFRMSRIPWGKGWKLYGVPILQCHRDGRVRIGDGLGLRSTFRSNPLAPSHPVVISTRRPGSRITIGSDFAMTGGTLCADLSITIGNAVAIGANSVIVDTDFHPLTPQARRLDPDTGECAPVVIEDDVFIGMNCIVLKGVTVGRGSVIAAGSVVTQSIPPGSLAGGNPARVLRSLTVASPASPQAGEAASRSSGPGRSLRLTVEDGPDE